MSDQAATATVPLEEVAARPREQTERETKRQPPYNVVLWNDDDHSYEYVILMLLASSATRPRRVFIWPRRWTRKAGSSC